jgi:hypothetical protein
MPSKSKTTTAFVYKWTHLPSLKWYIGSRTRQNAHLADGYICSSKIVKPLIISNPHEWTREILYIGTPDDAYQYETMLLEMFNAKDDTRSFNMHNNNGMFTTAGTVVSAESKRKMSIAKKGRLHSDEYKNKMSKIMKLRARKGPKSKPMSDETKQKISLALTGIPKSEKAKHNMSLTKKRGIPMSEDTKQKMSIAKLGNTPWNKGKTYTDSEKRNMSTFCKGKTWKLVNGKRVWILKGDTNAE